MQIVNRRGGEYVKSRVEYESANALVNSGQQPDEQNRARNVNTSAKRKSSLAAQIVKRAKVVLNRAESGQTQANALVISDQQQVEPNHAQNVNTSSKRKSPLEAQIVKHAKLILNRVDSVQPRITFDQQQVEQNRTPNVKKSSKRKPPLEAQIAQRTKTPYKSRLRSHQK